MEHSEAEVLFDAVIRARVRHAHYFVHFVRACVCVCVWVGLGCWWVRACSPDT